MGLPPTFPPKSGALILLGALTVSFVAVAEEAAPASAPAAATSAPAAPSVGAPSAGAAAAQATAKVEQSKWYEQFAGSTISYGHNVAATTLSRSAQPYYNPTYGHRLGLMPEWHPNEQLFVRGRWFLSQELTLSDSTRWAHEVELSDVLIDVGTSGWKEARTGIRIGGDVRLSLPTSKVSLAQTRVLAVGPSVSVSKNFNVLAGLSFAYSARFTYRFNRFTTPQLEGPTIGACGDARSPECAEFVTTGTRNTHFDLTHALSASFSPHEKVTLSSALLLSSYWLYPLAAAPAGVQGSNQLDPTTSTNLRNTTMFNLSVTYQPIKPLGLTLGAFTAAPMLGDDGQRLFPLFNRNTSLYLEAAIDVEAAAASLL
ncbi:MAG: hypothetical protein K1X89_27100 [Myxococcaceae bacterium]|nr:hypothetical protein [Myxococcaceae bacterium]